MKKEMLEFIDFNIKKYQNHINDYEKRRKEHIKNMEKEDLFSPAYLESLDKVVHSGFMISSIEEFIKVLKNIK